MDRNEKIVAAATVAIVAGSAAVFAIKARMNRKSSETVEIEEAVAPIRVFATLGTALSA